MGKEYCAVVMVRGEQCAVVRVPGEYEERILYFVVMDVEFDVVEVEVVEVEGLHVGVVELQEVGQVDR